MANYLNLKLFQNEMKKSKSTIKEFVDKAKENGNEAFLFLYKDLTQSILKDVRIACPNQFIDRGTYAIRNGKDFYFVELSLQTERKFWRIINNFVGAAVAIAEYKKNWQPEDSFGNEHFEYEKISETKLEDIVRQELEQDCGV